MTLNPLRVFADTGPRKLLAGSRRFAMAFFVFVAITSSANISFADEDGISFWIPGFFGSLAAAPQQPGWSLTSIYYHDDVSGSGNEAIARAIRLGLIPKVTVSISGNADVHAKNVNIGFIAPTYVFATPFLGGQVSASLLWQQRHIIERGGDCYCRPPVTFLGIHCAPARHDGVYGLDSHIRRSLECRGE